MDNAPPRPVCRPRPVPQREGYFTPGRWNPTLEDVEDLQAWSTPMRERPPARRAMLTSRYAEFVVRPVTVKSDSAWETPLVNVAMGQSHPPTKLPLLGFFSLHLGGILDDVAPLSATAQGIVGLPLRPRRVQQGWAAQSPGLPPDTAETFLAGLDIDPSLPTRRARPLDTGSTSWPTLSETDQAWQTTVASVPLSQPTPRGKMPPLGWHASGVWFDTLIVDRLFPWVQDPWPLPRPRPQPGSVDRPVTVKTDSAIITAIVNPATQTPWPHARLPLASHPSSIDVAPIIGGAISPAVGGPYVVLVGMIYQAGAVAGFCSVE